MKRSGQPALAGSGVAERRRSEAYFCRYASAAFHQSPVSCPLHFSTHRDQDLRRFLTATRSRTFRIANSLKTKPGSISNRNEILKSRSANPLKSQELIFSNRHKLGAFCGPMEPPCRKRTYERTAASLMHSKHRQDAILFATMAAPNCTGRLEWQFIKR